MQSPHYQIPAYKLRRVVNEFESLTKRFELVYHPSYIWAFTFLGTGTVFGPGTICQARDEWVSMDLESFGTADWCHLAIGCGPSSQVNMTILDSVWPTAFCCKRLITWIPFSNETHTQTDKSVSVLNILLSHNFIICWKLQCLSSLFDL